MKSIVNFTKPIPPEKPFPKLMICDGDIIMATNPKGNNCAIVASRNGNFDVGYISNWQMHRFTDFEGSVTLSND